MQTETGIAVYPLAISLTALLVGYLRGCPCAATTAHPFRQGI